MVAYSFMSTFAAPIIAREKRQTIRLPRKRHALPGERIQLYTGMRTRSCRKLIPDPVCVGVDEVCFDLRLIMDGVAPRFTVNGIPLLENTRDEYARGDGFPGMANFGVSPFAQMARWWVMTHGAILFEGVAIRWEDRDG